jgi:hypothetical protein
MEYRLTRKREQPELFNTNMKNWLRYLRNRAEKLGAPIIDTTNLSKKEVLEKFEEIGLFDSQNQIIPQYLQTHKTF